MKKKSISIILITVMLASALLTGCGNDKENESNEGNMRTAILQEFSKISEVPRDTESDMSGIKKYLTDRISDMGLTVKADDAGNLMAEKKATEGYENAPVTILQTNMDMVAQASPSVIFDKEKDPITPIVDEESKQIEGNNTSLGASSGIGMATALYVLENSINNGPVKAIFTVDGETDMEGAKNIEPKFLEGDYLINLNNEINDIIDIGSAYSCNIKASKKVNMKNTENKYSYILVADGFVGGDSGIGAQNNQGNPIKFLAEVLALARGEGLMYELNDFSGGDNIYDIPQTATATISVNEYEKGKVASIFNDVKKSYEKEHAESDPDANLDIIGTTMPEKALTDDDTANLISFLYGLTDGKYNDETNTTASSNIGTVQFTGKKISFGIFAQGKIEESLNRIIKEHTDIAKLCKVNLKPDNCVSGYYSLKKDFLPKTMHHIYNNVLDIDAEMEYCPTRTELGFFQGKNPELEIISIGPTIKNEGTVEEYASLKTIDIPTSAVLTFLSELNEK